ncbi:alpha/beta fold hydrolase [Mycolicibacterium sp.]|uniref:alpha/beta fold hydrolase n=1 Tax=Mycolicibacterium sp. TaxID=2320850 RepID=UPI003D0D4D7F
MTIRTALTAMAASVLLALAATGCGPAAGDPGPAPEPAAGPDKPTVVLVHGAFADSSSWNGVITRLQADGYPVIAAANPLRGLQADAGYVRSVVADVPGPVVLAGHSYGGTVISQAADGLPNVKALVYVASFLLEPGESTGELAAKFPGAQLGDALDTVPFPLPDNGTGEDLYIRQAEFQRVFAADVPVDVTALMAATQRPITAAALSEPASAAAWKTIPSWNLVTLQDLAIPAESMRFMGERAGARNVEVDASHAVTVSRPEVVADLIEQAAGSVGGR